MPMYRRGITSALCFVAACGLALALGATDAQARLRGTHKLSYRYDSRTSCSRSYASTFRQGTVKLRLTGRKVTLSFDEEERHTFGPSRSRFRRMRPGRSRHPTTRRTRRKITWKGRASTLRARLLRVTLKPSKQTCLALPYYGTKGAKPYRCRSVGSVSLRCRPVKVSAYPARRGNAAFLGKQEKSRPTWALQCDAKAWPSILRSAQFKKSVVLGLGRTLALFRTEGGLFSSWRRRPPFFRR